MKFIALLRTHCPCGGQQQKNTRRAKRLPDFLPLPYRLLKKRKYENRVHYLYIYYLSVS